MNDSAIRVLACDLMEDLLSGLEDDEIRRHLREQTGEDPTEEAVDDVRDEWFKLRAHIARRRARAEKEAR